MGRMVVAICVGGLLLVAPFVCVEAAVYVYVDAEGTPHFTDAPTKPHYRPLPAFGLPPGVNLAQGQYAELINGIAAGHGVDPALVRAIILAESNFDQHAVSRKGARGLMQLMPDTAGRYAVGDTFNPAENIRGGVQYLRFLQDLFPGQLHLAVAAYNAGENAVLRYNGIPPYPETREYVARVLRFYGQRGPAPAASPARPARPVAAGGGDRAAGSTPGVYRQVGADGTPLYTNLPPRVRPSPGSAR